MIILERLSSLLGRIKSFHRDQGRTFAALRFAQRTYVNATILEGKCQKRNETRENNIEYIFLNDVHKTFKFVTPTKARFRRRSFHEPNLID